MVRTSESLMRERYETDGNINLVFTFVVVAVLDAFFWSEASATGLIMWSIAMVLIAPIPHVSRRLDLSFRTWFVVEAWAQTATGLAWGSVVWMALPGSEVYQALLCAVLIGVLVASSSGESQFQTLYIAFMVPFTAAVISGYLFQDGGMVLCALFVGVAFAFSMIQAHGHRMLHVGFVKVLLENELLVAELEAERDAMAEVNHRLDRMAWTDALTGLANRAAMNRHLDEMLATTEAGSSSVTVAYLDLDGFKAINDTRGHRIGDLVLVEVGRRLEGAVADDELVCRLGGDELIVLSHTTDLPELGERLASQFDRPFVIEGDRLVMGAGIGLASTRGACSADHLVMQADRALYRHKGADGPRSRFLVHEARSNGAGSVGSVEPAVGSGPRIATFAPDGQVDDQADARDVVESLQG